MDKPKKNVSAARKVLHKFLRLVDKAEKRGLTLCKECAKLRREESTGQITCITCETSKDRGLFSIKNRKSQTPTCK